VIITFKENHPILWRTSFIVAPFVAGIAAYFALAAIAPSYPQSIRTFLDANLQPLRDLPVVTQLLGPRPSTEPDSPAESLMKHYATLKSEPDQTPIVSDTRLQSAEMQDDFDESRTDGVTWNTTNTGNLTPDTPPDMGGESNSPLFQLAESEEPDTRIRALEALSGASGRPAVRACVEGLIDSDAAVRRHAARAMADADREVLYREWIHVLQFGPPELLEAFDLQIPQLQDQLESNALAGLASGQSARIEKLAAIYTLGRIRSDAALPLLTGYAWAEDITLAQTATAAIAEIRSADAVGALADLTGHYDADIRWYATNGLGVLKGEDALATLEAIIESGLEPVQEIRVLAINHLGDAGDAGSVATLMDALRRYPGLRYDSMYALAQITGIQDFSAPFQWKEWYEEWSITPEAEALSRRRRQVPSTLAAVMPIEATTPASSPFAETEVTPDLTNESPSPQQEVAIRPDSEVATAPPVPTAQTKPPVKKPLQIKRTSGGGSFGTSDLSPAELMRRGGFSSSKP